jgi:hypothetical protein
VVKQVMFAAPSGDGIPAARAVRGSFESLSEVAMSMYDKGGSGMNEEEALRFNRYWIAGTGVWVLGAVGAHLLAWSWRPWF